MNKINPKRLTRRRFTKIEDMKNELKEALGDIEASFVMIVWGQPAQGKSNFVFQLAKEFSHFGGVLYMSLEESLSLTLQMKVNQYLNTDDPHENRIKFTDHTTSLADLTEYLKRPRSAKTIIIDSLQYFGINFIDYKHLKKQFPKKRWIFISHAKGRLPDGKTADKIRYDADMKIRVEGKIAFVESRFGGKKNYVIWEEGAKKYWGKEFKKMINLR